MALDRPLRFGAFFAPFHPVGQNPTLALEYDLERTVEPRPARLRRGLVRRAPLGRLRADRLPRGLHRRRRRAHSKHVKLGTGVVSLPYHHPWLVADRLNLLDHLTAGAVIFGAGPGRCPPTPT